MTRTARIITATIVVVVLGGLVIRTAVVHFYATPRGELQESIDDATARVASYRKAIDDVSRVDTELSAFADRTLGADVENVDHRLRMRLNRIAEAVGLEGATVGTGSTSAKRSPARSAFPRRGDWKSMRDEIDFVEVEGWISGQGSLDQVIRLIDRIDFEPWPKRVNQLRIDPKGDGERMAVTVRLTTIFLPGHAPSPDGEAVAYDPERLARLEPLMRSNPFRVPAADTPPPAPTVVETGPAPDPLDAWQLTGVAAGPGGAEAWLRHSASGAARSLALGDRLGKATLVAANGEWAEFRLNRQRFRVRIGARFGDRTLIDE